MISELILPSESCCLYLGGNYFFVRLVSTAGISSHLCELSKLLRPACGLIQEVLDT